MITTKCPFAIPEFHSGNLFTFSCHVYVGSSWLWQFSFQSIVILLQFLKWLFVCFYFKMLNFFFHIVGMGEIGVVCSMWFSTMKFQLWLVEMRESQFHVRSSEIWALTHTARQDNKYNFTETEVYFTHFYLPQLIYQANWCTPTFKTLVYFALRHPGLGLVQ